MAEQPSSAPLPHHVSSSVQELTELENAHHESASRPQVIIDAVTDRLGRPTTLVAILGVISVWIAAAALADEGGVASDILVWLELSATLAAFLVALLILATQRHADKLAARQAQLSLELALASDRRPRS